jgi:hypothetical protein
MFAEILLFDVLGVLSRSGALTVADVPLGARSSRGPCLFNRATRVRVLAFGHRRPIDGTAGSGFGPRPGTASQTKYGRLSNDPSGRAHYSWRYRGNYRCPLARGVSLELGRYVPVVRECAVACTPGRQIAKAAQAGRAEAVFSKVVNHKLSTRNLCC